MGIYIGLELDVDKTTKEDWEKAFYKAGEFVEKTPLIELTSHNVLGENIYIYTKSKIQDDKYIKIDADSNTYIGAESFKIYKDFNIYKEGIPKMDNGRVSIWYNKTQEASYHKYVLATALILEYFLPNKIQITGDINKKHIEESKKIVKELYNLDIMETSALKNIVESNNMIKLFMGLFGIIEEEVDYDVLKDEFDLIKRLELISIHDLNKKGIKVDEMTIEELKIGLFKASKNGNYIWNLDTLNIIADSDDMDLLKKYYVLLSLNLYSGSAFDECEIEFFPKGEIKDLRKPKKLISKLVTYY